MSRPPAHPPSRPDSPPSDSPPPPATPKNKALLATGRKNICLLINPPPARPEAQRVAVVLGVERGGTSMAAGVLRALGVDMGRWAGFNHEDPRFLKDDHDHLRQVIELRSTENAVWGFKMPKSVFHLPFLAKHLPNPYYVVVHRNLAAVADSWSQRGTEQVLDAFDRALTYHRLIIDHARITRRPVLVLNYERAVADPRRTAGELADFFGLSPDEATLERAAGMITGDGKGYINLPEHFFAATPLDAMPDRPPVATVGNRAKLTDAEGWITFATPGHRVILLPAGGGVLPPSMWLRLTLDAPPDFDISTDPVRIYFDFTGAFNVVHSVRPPLRRGVNTLLLETSGKAARISFGAVEPGTRLRLIPELFVADVEDEALAGDTAHTLPQPPRPGPRHQGRGLAHTVRALFGRRQR